MAAASTDRPAWLMLGSDKHKAQRPSHHFDYPTLLMLGLNKQEAYRPPRLTNNPTLLVLGSGTHEACRPPRQADRRSRLRQAHRVHSAHGTAWHARTMDERGIGVCNCAA
eukprot:365573-Chlamydomonas_euryale.AAC.8